MTFVFTTDTLIATIALSISLISIFINLFNNKYHLEITYPEYNVEKGMPFYYFNIVNTSKNAIKIKNIEIFSNGSKINNIDFDYEKYLDDKSRAEYDGAFLRPISITSSSPEYLLDPEPFDGNEFWLGNLKSQEFGYFLEQEPTEIKIYSNHFLRLFRKNKSFTVIFNREEQ